MTDLKIRAPSPSVFGQGEGQGRVKLHAQDQPRQPPGEADAERCRWLHVKESSLSLAPLSAKLASWSGCSESPTGSQGQALSYK